MPLMKSIAIIEAPSILGLRPTGVERLPDALVNAGLLARLHARHAERVNARCTVVLVTQKQDS
jgi:arginase